MDGVLAAGMDLQGFQGLIAPNLLPMTNISGSSLTTAPLPGLVGATGAAPTATQQVILSRSRKLVLDGSTELGSGTYGTVFKAKYNCLPCVAKVLHPKFQSGALRETVHRECGSLLSTIRHPNIVLFIDVQEYWPPSPASGSQPLLALVMEAMDMNLTTYMKKWRRSTESRMPWHVLVDVSQDVMLALHYLHARGLAYLLLSSNNVLLQNGRAKISDHGVTRLQAGSRADSAYTAPEARMNMPSLHSDVFSFGVLLIQMVTLKNPEPKFMLAHDIASGSLTMATELSRRKSDFALVPRKHRLRPMMLHCIADSEQTRPTTEELCTDFEVMKRKREYQRSVAKKRKHQQRSASSSDTSSDSESETSDDESTSSTEDNNSTSESSDN